MFEIFFLRRVKSNVNYGLIPVCFLAAIIANNVKCLTLDYHWYSQLSDELKFDHENIVNYFNLNNRTIDRYDEYLHFSEDERLRLKNMAKQMFEFGYDNYMKYAFPLDELDPIHCTGRGPDYANRDNININDVLGDYMTTLVDSLSTLAVLGNSSEFKRASRLVIDYLDFDKNNTVQVFEATIRILGGLLSAHLIATDSNQPFGDMKIPDYNDQLLNLAHDLGNRLLNAFNNENMKLPFPRVNLKYGVPVDSFNHTCTSGAGTLILEFAMLSYLLNDPIYEKVAQKTIDSIYSRRNNTTGLFGNEINIHTGEWLGMMSGLGAGVDSFVEYLLKSYIIYGDEKHYKMFEEIKHSVENYMKHGRHECLDGTGHHPIYLNVNMENGKIINNWIDSLQAFYPSVQVLDGDLDDAICFHALYFAIWKKFGVLPERFNWNLKLPDVYFYPLRPEFAESNYFLYRATKNPFYLHVAKLIIENIYQISKVKCGFATVHDVLDKSLEDRMESFFLSETIKYLYLTFDKENYLNNEGEMQYIFTTEGHLYPLKIAYELKSKSLKTNKAKQKNSSFNRSSSFKKSKFKTVRQGENLKSWTFSHIDDYDDDDDDDNNYGYYGHGAHLNDNSHSTKKCNLKNKPLNHRMRFNLPMKIKYFDQLFEMVGLSDNLDKLLDRKST